MEALQRRVRETPFLLKPVELREDCLLTVGIPSFYVRVRSVQSFFPSSGDSFHQYNSHVCHGATIIGKNSENTNQTSLVGLGRKACKVRSICCRGEFGTVSWLEEMGSMLLPS